MAHRVCAASLHAARLVLEKYTIEVKTPEELTSGAAPNIRADEKHLAVLIDLATNIFELAILRPKISHWQTALYNNTATAPQLAFFLNELREAFEKIPKNEATPVVRTISVFPPGCNPMRGVLTLSKASREAARFIFHYYRVCPINGLPDEQDRTEVASIVDMALGVEKVFRAQVYVLYCLLGMKEGKLTHKQISTCFREIGVHIDSGLANYEQSQEEVKLLT